MIKSMKSIVNNIARIRTIAVAVLLSVMVVDAIVWLATVLMEQ